MPDMQDVPPRPQDEREVILLNVGTENGQGVLVGGTLTGRAVKAYALRSGDKLTGGTVAYTSRSADGQIIAYAEQGVWLGQWNPDTLIVLEVPD